MKELNIPQMEEIEGGSIQALLCGAAFYELAGWTAFAFALAGPATLGLGFGMGLLIGAAGVATCSQA